MTEPDQRAQDGAAAPTSADASQSTSKTKAAFSSLKNKAGRYMSSIAAMDGPANYTRGFSNLISAGSVAAGPVPVEPSEDEVLMIYPSYCRLTATGEYEVDVRGWLYVQGPQNKRSRMVHATARKIAGIKSLKKQQETANEEVEVAESDEDNEEAASLQKEFVDAPTRTSTSSDMRFSASMADHEETLKARLGPFLSRSVAGRSIKITFSGLTDISGESMKVFHAETNSAGRFSTRITIDRKPSIISVEAHELLVSFEEIIYVPPYGVSVISDIDDTIKNTGILGSKRELFRNLFVYDYDQIAIEGVQEWYKSLADQGAMFHYVSNSPWQLYPTISSYMHSANFPQGSMHLKEYNGLLNGLFEPASERKKQNLHNILRDFPHRKFVLIGDSGEGDLEAYIDVAREFPTQIAALYIRDVTMPDDGELDADLSNIRRNLIPRPDEIDMYDKSVPILQTLQPRKSPLSVNKPTGMDQISSSVKLDMDSTKSTSPAQKPIQPSISDVENTNSISTPLSNPKPIVTSAYPAPPSAPSNPANPYAAANPYTAHLTKQEPNPYNTTPYTPSPPPESFYFETDDNLETRFWHPAWDEDDIPPPMPKRPSPPVAVKEDAAPPPPPIRTSQSRISTLRAPSDDFELASVLDKKVEQWKYRVMSSRVGLPSEIKLKIWKTGHDVRDEAVEAVRREVERTRKLAQESGHI